MRVALAGLTALVTFIVPSIGSERSVPPVRRVPATTVPLHDFRPFAATTTTTIPEPETRKAIPDDPDKRCPELEDDFVRHGLPPKVFSYIAWRESRCNPLAHNKTRNRNGTQDYGAVQINSSWVTVTQQVCGGKRGDMTVLFDLDCNLSVARYLYENGGLGHWSL